MPNDRPSRLVRLFLYLLLTAVVFPPAASPQGMASGNRTAAKAKSLPQEIELPEARYVDVAPQAGLTGVNVSGVVTHTTYIVEATGTGVAIFDFDSDGLQDIFLVNAGRLQKEGGEIRHHLYRNQGGLRFEEVTGTGLEHTGWGQGVCAGDVDNDARVDLFITHWGQNVLYRNQGGKFTNETNERGLIESERRWSTGCSFLDYDRDGDLDLFVAHYIDFDPAKTPKPGESPQCRYRGVAVACGPMGLPGESMSLYQNDGAGNFRDVSKEAGIATEKHFYGFTPLTGDFDNDGFIDIYVACDSTASLLFRNRGDGSFEEIGVLSGTAYNEHGLEQAGMGATAADIDGDGLLDIFKTNFSNDANTLYRNEGDWLFTDETVRRGLAVEIRYVGWGTAFLDYDHDGRKDIFVANGHFYPGIDETNANETFHQPRLLYWNGPGRHFYDATKDAGPALEARHSSRGIAVGDLDNDGIQEIVVVNMNEKPSLLRNEVPPGGNSLLIQTLTTSGRDAVGARVTVTAGGQSQIDEVRSGGYHISQGDFRLHFGIGSQTKADVTIRWPDGNTGAYKDLEAGTWTVIQKGKGPIQTHQLKQK